MTIEQGEIWWGEASVLEGPPLPRPHPGRGDPGAPHRARRADLPHDPADPHGDPARDLEGLPVASVASMDGVLAFPKSMLVRRMGALAPERRHELGDALAAAIDR